MFEVTGKPYIYVYIYIYEYNIHTHKYIYDGVARMSCRKVYAYLDEIM